MNTKLEIRTIATPPSMSEDSTISGYAIVYGVESRVLYDEHGEFVEIIEPGAVTSELLARSDVKALFNHGRDNLLARYVNGEGSLSLVSDEVGLRFSFVAPATSLGRDVAELIKRGDLRGCSFAFWAREEDCEYSLREDGTRLRRVKKLSMLSDVSVVVDPAYTQTSVTARSFNAPPKAKTKTLAEARRIINEIF